MIIFESILSVYVVLCRPAPPRGLVRTVSEPSAGASNWTSKPEELRKKFSPKKPEVDEKAIRIQVREIAGNDKIEF